MKKISIIVVAILLVLFGVVFGMNGDDATSQEEQKMKIGTTIFPIYDMTQRIAGDGFEVVPLLPPGASPHTFDPQPSLLKDLEGTRAVFAIGHGLDGWADTIAASIDAPVVTLDHDIALRETADEAHDHDHEDEHEHEHEEDEHEADLVDGHDEDEEDHHDHGPIDPHYWLSVHNAVQMAQNIAAELSKFDSENSAAYTERAAAYIAELEALETDLEDAMDEVTGNRNIIAFHDAWYYFANELGLDLVGTFAPSAGKEPTPQYLANLEKEVAIHDVATLFIEPQLSTASVEAFARDHNLKIAVIDPLGGVEGRESYIALMRYNVAQVIEALTTNEE